MSQPDAVLVKDRPGTDRELVVYPPKHVFSESEALRHADFVARSRELTCKTVAEETRGRDLAVVVWVEPGGEFRALRVSRTDSIFREFVPDYLRRGRQ